MTRIGIDARAAVKTTDGIGRYAVELLKAYSARNDDCEYVVFKHPNLEFSFALDSRFTEIILPTKRFSPVEQIWLPLVLRTHNLDLFHSLHFTLPIFYGGLQVLTVHDVMPAILPWFFGKQDLRKKVASKYLTALVRKSIQKASGIIVDSDHTAQDLVSYFDIPRDAIARVYLGIDHFVVNPDGIGTDSVLNKFGLRSPYFFVITNFRPYKNLPRILEAFSIVRSRFRDVELIVAGSNPKYKSQALEGLPSGWMDGVKFLGFIDDADLPRLLSNARAFVFPSLYEGFGLPVLESMKMGVPVITARAASLPELGGDAVCYVNPKDANEIAVAMIDLLVNDKLRMDMIKLGEKQAKMFSWRITAEQTWSVYKDAMKAWKE